jgi:predicted transglutaminase-like cysteine proteinase
MATRNSVTMAHPFDIIGRAAAAAIAIGLSSAEAASPVNAASRARQAWPVFTAVVENAKPPNGWAEFCAHYKGDCDVKPSAPRNIVLDSKTWEKLVSVNKWANQHIKPVTDMRHWGRVNKWYYAEDGRGDCKDYVLVKRKKLMEAGLPREALLITIVWTRQNQGHAVLIARTDKGDYVLDNLSSKIALWSETGYDFVKRQSQSDPNAWVYIDGDPRPQPRASHSVLTRSRLR